MRAGPPPARAGEKGGEKVASAGASAALDDDAEWGECVACADERVVDEDEVEVGAGDEDDK